MMGIQKGAVSRRLARNVLVKNNRYIWTMGRLFLFALKSQSHNANDYKTKLKQFRICNHPHHLPS